MLVELSAPASKPMSRRQAAEYLNLSVRTLNQWACRKVGPAFSRSGSVRGRVWYTREALDRWLASRQVLEVTNG
jgi:hypothetical protein